MVYIQQILNNEKKFYRLAEVRKHKVPLWPELAVHRIWLQAVQHPEFMRYIPDTWTAKKKTERAFFWEILSTLQPDYVEALIKDAREQREAARRVAPII